MRPLVLNVSIGPDLHHAELPFGEQQVRDLAAQQLLSTAIRFVSQPASPVTEPRLRCETQGWHDVLMALRRRYREDMAARCAPIDDRQVQIDRAMLILKGRPDQVARLDAGTLPEQDIAAVARRELFAALDGFQKFSGNWHIKASEIPHARGCIAAKTAPGTYETRDRLVATLDDIQRLTYGSIDGMVACIRRGPGLVGVPVTTARVDIQDHVGWCHLCRAGEVGQATAKVTVEWNERKLVREYVL